MQKPKFIQKMIDKNNERKLNKPTYKIEDLYVGEIIYITDIEFVPGPTLLRSGHKYSYKHIKRFAIFYHDPFSNYLHIVSNHELDTSLHCRVPNKYVIHYDSLNKLEDVMQPYMLKHNLKPSSKLSINDIKEIERIYNEHHFPDQKHDDLFWGI